MQLRALSRSEFIASLGKFRAVIIIDSEEYQIESDTSIEEARLLCAIAATEYSPVSIFNDTGESVR